MRIFRRLWMWLLPERFAIIGRKADGNGGFEYDIIVARSNDTAEQWCSELNEQSMFDGSEWYYTYIPQSDLPQWKQQMEDRESRRLQH